MPEITFIVRLPDGVKMECYSPSTIVRDYFRAGESMPMIEFVNRSKSALNQASERVKAKYGFECSSAMAQINRILETNQRYPEGGQVEILSI
jgi:uncharacterized repeat protein (TIGR04042 family)